MIIFCNKSGQLGNRLFAFAHLIANAAANRYSVVNLSFDEYAQYFETTSKDTLCRYPAVSSRIVSDALRSHLFVVNKAIVKLLRLLKINKSFFHRIIVADLPHYRFDDDRYYDMNQGSFTDIAKKKITFVFGRFFRDYSNLEEHQAYIRDYFKPLPHLRNNVNRCYQLAKQNFDVVVGVHIRRGDYKEFANGKYFYSDKEYFDEMCALQLSTRPRKIRFVICSNETIDTANFSELNVIQGTGHFVEDMYLLAKCDYIMGPPSTFTLWASFYGNKPLYQIRHVGEPIGFEKFVLLPPKELYNYCFN